jgi:hypothetical protein
MDRWRGRVCVCVCVRERERESERMSGEEKGWMRKFEGEGERASY